MRDKVISKYERKNSLKKPPLTLRKQRSQTLRDLGELLQIAQLRAEKCEMKESKAAFLLALSKAKKSRNPKAILDALGGLLNLAGESLINTDLERWDLELDRLMIAFPKQVLPMVWYYKGLVAHYMSEPILAQRFLHRYLKMIRKNTGNEESIARGWLMLAHVFFQRNRFKRTYWLVNEILRIYEKKSLRNINGITYLIMGSLHEKQKDYKTTLRWYKKASIEFLKDHHWYFHLYVLLGLARLARYCQNYSQAYFYIEFIENVTSSGGLNLLQREVSIERRKLRECEIDLLVDCKKGMLKTRERGVIFIRKKYVLLQILEALFVAHQSPSEDLRQGLPKAKLFEIVWKEPYQAEIHDSKLYYNINRLRKLIEPNIRKPKYLLHWRYGYRLAPNLRVRFIGEQALML